MRIAFDGGCRLRSFDSLPDLIRTPAECPCVAMVPATAAADAALADVRVPLILYGNPGMLAALDGVRFDDYLADPWTGDELRFRVGRLLGASSLSCSAGRIRWGRFWIAAAEHGGGESVATLTPEQHAAFDVLARARGEVVPREVLLALAREQGSGSRALDMRMARLRGRLSQITRTWTEQPELRSLRGLGYRLDCR